ncbi:glycosyltransferase involved in cell wall biosynthesis [Rhodococcus sp. OK611]|uniref:glycosyltransferase n=1 Tax=unclassified Rhodococcus (in: high G+C Gram-positive bacteria) TaxID=192944 RepID=UPI000BD1AADC|nr:MULTISPECIES: glycosyltransferase [unclassified Rhodococcus (in: high G+C Gram-positive bacteria)]PTR42820.1 glycosyltransferase involved in cell wall biosynthesis [Rhodococcus sp. OK611]SNX91823.1 Glycosyltransferase involved in cell wall bisynthesis [Rhodococcus sp. OK270]
MARELDRAYLRRGHDPTGPPAHPTRTAPALSVLIVTYKSNALVEKCLSAVATHLPGRSVHVYENTGDGHPGREDLAARHPDVNWVMGSVNIGYAAAVNALVDHTPPDTDLLFLNPDATLLGPLTKTLALIRRPGVAAVSPLIKEGDEDPAAPGRNTDWDVARRKVNLLRALVDTAGYSARLRRTPLSYRYARQPFAVEGYVGGACLAVNRDAWNAIGPFDEEFFLYGEETDWQYRARSAGWRILLADEVGAEHSDHTPRADGDSEGRRNQDLLRTNSALILEHQRGVHRADAYLAGSALLERVQRSTRELRRSRPAPHPDRPAVIITSNRLVYGGAERQKALLATELDKRGYQVTLVCLQRYGPLLREIPHSIRVLRHPWWAPSIEINSGPAVVISGDTNTEAGFSALWRRLGPDRRWLVAAHTPPDPGGPTYSLALGAAMRQADGFIALAEKHWEELTAYQNLGDRWFSVPNGVISSVALRDPVARSPRIDRRPLQLVMLSRIVAHKNPHLLIEALDGLRELSWELSIFGDGPDRERLEALTPRELRHRVHWRGWSAGPEPALADCDLLCVPSRSEAFPLVILEAMARQIPVAASGVCAVPEMLAHGEAGVVVDPVSVANWRSTLARCINEPDGLPGIGRRGFERMRANYTIEVMADAYVAAIESVQANQGVVRAGARR